jgi:hypothetical protein
VPLRVGRRTIAQKSVRLKPFMEASLRKQSLAFELLSSLIPVISPRSVGRSLSASRAAWLQQHCPGGTHAPLASVAGTLRSGPAVSSVLKGTRQYLTPLHGLVSRFCVPSHQQRTGSVAFAFAFPTRIRAPLRCPRWLP